MKHMTILVPSGEGNNLSSIVGTYKIFSRANQLWKERHGQLLFKIELAATESELEFYEGIFAVRPQKNISEIVATDLIIIPSLNHNYAATVKCNQMIIEWMADRYNAGAEVASICTGAFLLAASGLLEGKRCSTHWAAAENFRKMFPDVDLQIDQVITDENGIYTNGGAYSFLNLIIYLIEKYYNRETAIVCAKIFQIEIDRNTQSAFSIFSGQKGHEDSIVKNVQVYIEDNYPERISFSDVSRKFAVGRRNFDRRFIKATGNTPVEYLQRVRVESAKKALETTDKNINEVMFDVGYVDVKAFREVFRRITGLSPLDYRHKYNKVAAL